MPEEPEDWVPEGAAVMPVIPEELGVHPLLLAALHAVVFLEGSDDMIVHPDAAVEAMEYMAGYLQRVRGPELQKMREDLMTLTSYGKEMGWDKQSVGFFKEFLEAFGVGAEEEV